MRHTTHKLTPEQKEALYTKYKDLIYMIHCCNGYLLRRQIRKFFHLLTGRDEKDIEFDIAELICTGFLLQKQICKDSRTQMLYLSKYPRSHFHKVERSGDVPAISWSNQKIFQQIFIVDYIIEKIISEMKNQNFSIDIDNIMTYLLWTGSNLLLNTNQINNAEFYQRFLNIATEAGYTLSYDFIRDKEIADFELDSFNFHQLGKSAVLPNCPAKIHRNTEKDSYHSEIEQNKQFFSLTNFSGHGFIFDGFDRQKPQIIKLCYFDSTNTIQTKKLYQNLSYILLMFHRYLNKRNIEIQVNVYVWDKKRKIQLHEEECKQAYDFYRQEWVVENKKNKVMKDVGLLPQYWDDITVQYISEEIYPKYNVHP